NDECCPSPISRPAKTIDLGMVSGRAPRNAARRSHPRCDPIRVVDSSRPPVRNACPAPPIGWAASSGSALWPVRPAAVAVLATGGATVARRGGAGSAGDRRSVAPRSVYSPLVAPFATSWTTTHRFAVSRSNWAPGRGESSLGRSADPRRAAQARNCRLRTHGVAIPARAAEETVTDLAYIPRESARPVH